MRDREADLVVAGVREREARVGLAAGPEAVEAPVPTRREEALVREGDLGVARVDGPGREGEVGHGALEHFERAHDLRVERAVGWRAHARVDVVETRFGVAVGRGELLGGLAVAKRPERLVLLGDDPACEGERHLRWRARPIEADVEGDARGEREEVEGLYGILDAPGHVGHGVRDALAPASGVEVSESRARGVGAVVEGPVVAGDAGGARRRGGGEAHGPILACVVDELEVDRGRWHEHEREVGRVVADESGVDDQLRRVVTVVVEGDAQVTVAFAHEPVAGPRDDPLDLLDKVLVGGDVNEVDALFPAHEDSARVGEVAVDGSRGASVDPGVASHDVELEVASDLADELVPSELAHVDADDVLPDGPGERAEESGGLLDGEVTVEGDLEAEPRPEHDRVVRRGRLRIRDDAVESVCRIARLDVTPAVVRLA